MAQGGEGDPGRGLPTPSGPAGQFYPLPPPQPLAVPVGQPYVPPPPPAQPPSATAGQYSFQQFTYENFPGSGAGSTVGWVGGTGAEGHVEWGGNSSRYDTPAPTLFSGGGGRGWVGAPWPNSITQWSPTAPVWTNGPPPAGVPWLAGAHPYGPPAGAEARQGGWPSTPRIHALAVGGQALSAPPAPASGPAPPTACEAPAVPAPVKWELGGDELGRVAAVCAKAQAAAAGEI